MILSLRAGIGRIPNRRIVIAAVAFHLVCGGQLRTSGAEVRTRIIEGMGTVNRVAPRPLRASGTKKDWKAVSLCANGEIVVWHDSEAGRLIFHDFIPRHVGSERHPTFAMDSSQNEQLKYCLVSSSRQRTALVFSDGKRIQVVIMRYPEMSEDARFDIRSKQGLYCTAAAFAPSGVRLAVASNRGVSVFDNRDDRWQRGVCWPLPLPKLASMEWSSNDQLLAVGGIHNLYAARIRRDDDVEALDMRAVPKFSERELLEHTQQGTQEQLFEDTLYQLGLRLRGVYGVGFSEKQRLLAASGATRGRESERTIDGFVAFWDVRSTHLVSCDIIPRTSALGVKLSEERGSYFVSVFSVENSDRVVEIANEDGRIKGVYRGMSDSDPYRSIEQFAVLRERSLLIGIEKNGRALSWQLSEEEAEAQE